MSLHGLQSTCFHAGNKGDLILRKLESARAGPAAKPVPGTASVSESTRQAGVQRILQALRTSAAAQGATEPQLLAAARVTLLEIFRKLMPQLAVWAHIQHSFVACHTWQYLYSRVHPEPGEIVPHRFVPDVCHPFQAKLNDIPALIVVLGG